ncbi:hypothetical protein [Leptolyngbya sp. 7M]|uniref:hypothetical protein n=1 Tax=Leptolyngbya sp. 7M TaxID=2812896 RepID=UPI001B8BA433|nr:hypothetical protein [Leptolyngbya sp. 7M]QYO62837.1 hypothetical protein JVX88_22845 [Leptolyngbya sp. 7M]
MQLNLQLKRLAQFTVRKLIRLVLLLMAVSLFSFVLVSLSPVDPINAYVGAEMLQIGPEQRHGSYSRNSHSSNRRSNRRSGVDDAGGEENSLAEWPHSTD